MLNKSLKPELFLRGFLFQIRLQSPILEEFYSARLLNLQSWPEVITIQLLKYTDTLLQRWNLRQQQNINKENIKTSKLKVTYGDKGLRVTMPN